MITVRLDSLRVGRTFFYEGRKFRVLHKLGVAGVSVKLCEHKKVTIPGKRAFWVECSSQPQVWTCSAEVEIRVKQVKIKSNQE